MLQPLLFIGLLHACIAGITVYTLDSVNICDSVNIMTKWLSVDDVIIVHGKTDPDTKFSECVLKFGPSSLATKKSVVVKLETYYNQDCGVFLSVQQSSTQFFESDVTTLLNISCNTRPWKESVYYADAGNNIKIILKKGEKSAINFNFRMNITLNDHKVITMSNVSEGVIIGIAVLIAVLIPGIVCILYRYRKIRLLTKRFDRESVSGDSTRYSNLPIAERVQHSQTCIVGSQDASGMCTVCHRHHDDFAHVVDFGPDGQVHNISSHRDRHREEQHDGQSSNPNIQSGHEADSGADSIRHASFNNSRPPAELPVGSQGHRGHGSSNGFSIATSGLTGTNDVLEDVGDEDFDLSGNDLIPPSYDLSPPSYDEAIHMPKPDLDTSTGASQHPQSEERDPLYQNIETLDRNSS